MNRNRRRWLIGSAAAPAVAWRSSWYPGSRIGAAAMGALSAIAPAGFANARTGAESSATSTPIPLPSTMLTSDGVRLRLLRREALPGAPAPRLTMVFVPGWCMPADIWRYQLEDTASAWAALAMDPRGQGGSEVPASGYTAERRADDLHDVLATIDGPVVLVGWSLGVLEALQYIDRYGTQRLRGLVLVDNSIGEPPPPSAGGHFAADLARDRRATLDRFVRAMFSRPPPDDLLEIVLASAQRMPMHASLVLLSYPFPREHWRLLVHALDIPFAYVVTKRFLAQGRHLLEARPDSTVEIFESAGHALFVDEADRFNTLLRDWVARQGLAG